MLDRDAAICRVLARMAREDRPRRLVAHLRYQRWLTARGPRPVGLGAELARLDALIASRPAPLELVREVMGERL